VRCRLMLRAVHSGLPVVRVGRGNTEGLHDLDQRAAGSCKTVAAH
jgi:hypothetical protein